MDTFILKNSLCMDSDSHGRSERQVQTYRGGDIFLCEGNKVRRVAEKVIQLFTVWVKTVNSLDLRSSRNISQTRLLGKTSVLVEINAEKMERLLEAGQICLSDVHCLDEESRQYMKGLCLKTCLKRKCTTTQRV